MVEVEVTVSMTVRDEQDRTRWKITNIVLDKIVQEKTMWFCKI
jgi:hypothetical protein